MTAVVIGWQSWETRKAAQASRDNIALFLAKERARLAIEVRRCLWYRNTNTIGEYLDAPAVEFRATNLGPTHAFNVRLFVSYMPTETDTPVALPTTKEIASQSAMKAEAKDWHPHFRLDIAGLDDLGGIIGGTKWLQLGGKLTYSDVFAEERETRFRYIYKKGNGRDEWVEHGLDSENEAT